MTADAFLLYFTGVLSGALVSWFLMRYRVQMAGGLNREILWETVTQKAFIRATSDVIEDDETHRSIQDRANEILDEHDVPGEPEWRYGQ